MFLTEDEAKKKVCPHIYNPDSIYNCFASGCMFWREGGSEYEHKSIYELLGIRQNPVMIADVAQLHDAKESGRIEELTKGWEPYGKKDYMWGGFIAYRKLITKRGFCGLAGKPEAE